MMTNYKLRLVTLAAWLNAVTVGFASIYSFFAVESMKKTGKLHPDDTEIYWIGNTLPLGAILGGIIAAYLSDKIGRKGVMIYQSLPLVLGWLFISYAPSLTFVYIGRFMTGVCCGLICAVTPMYAVEICTTEVRDKLCGSFPSLFCLGILIQSCPGVSFKWEWVAIYGAIIGVIILICILFIPESPCWLVLNNKQSEAVYAANLLYGSTGESSVNQLASESLNVESTHIALHEILHPTFYKPAVFSVLLMFFQQFSGIIAIFNFTVSNYSQGADSMNLKIAVNVFIVFMIGGTGLFMGIGKKKALYISGLVTALSLNGMSIYLLLSAHEPSLKSTYHMVPVVCSFFYVFSFSVGLGPLPWLMMSEMSPVRSRGLICGISTAFLWIFVFAVTNSSFLIEPVYGTYWIYSAVCLCSCFFAYFFLPETKGKTLEEIENFFAGGESHLQRLQESSNDSVSDIES